MTARHLTTDNDPFWAGVERSARELENWPTWKLRSLGMLDSPVVQRILERRQLYPNRCTVECTANTGNGNNECEDEHG